MTKCRFVFCLVVYCGLVLGLGFGVTAYPSNQVQINESDLYILDPVTMMSTGEEKRIENCDPTVCQNHICKIKGSISRPSFYARCSTGNHIQDTHTDIQRNLSSSLENHTSSYCMCSTSYRVSSTSEHYERSYVRIVPGSNCIQDERHCSSQVCRGNSKKSHRIAYLCNYQQKFYCACFN